METLKDSPLSEEQTNTQAEKPVPYKKRFGDRKDGRLIRSLAPLNRVALYIMPNRRGASVYFHDSFEITEVENYIRKKRKQGKKLDKQDREFYQNNHDIVDLKVEETEAEKALFDEWLT